MPRWVILLFALIAPLSMAGALAYADNDLTAARNAAQMLIGQASNQWFDGLTKDEQTTNQSLDWGYATPFKDVFENVLVQESQAALLNFQAPSGTALGETLRSQLANTAGDLLVGGVRDTGFLFLRNLDVSYAWGEGGTETGAIRTIDALYESPGKRETVFFEGGLARAEGRTTLNAGVGYRYLVADSTWMLGGNAFYDREWPYDHSRVSLGIEAIRRDFRVFANRYVGLTGWDNTRLGYQERVLNGWDVGLSGRLPKYRKVNLTAAGYVWPQHDDAKTIYGTRFEAAYTPKPWVTFGLNLAKDNQSDWLTGLNVRFSANPAKVAAEIEPGSVADLNLTYVNRENRIRVQERQDPRRTGNVLESVGANSVIGPAGVSAPLVIGSAIAYGSRVIVANSVGAYAELGFGDGGRLRLANDSEVVIEAHTLTLVRGVMQFVSGGTNVTINTPGGSVQLEGTDIDVVSDGVTSSVRVRDGAIRGNGTPAVVGQVLALAGTGILLNANDPAGVTHRQEVYERLDTTDPTPLNISKAAPYLYRDVTVVQSPAGTGDPIVLALDFSKPVALTGSASLDFTLNGVSRSAVLAGGNGTSTLLFSYTTVLADAGEDTVAMAGLTLSGGNIGAGGQAAVSFVPSLNLALGSNIAVSGTLVVTVSSSAPNITAASPIPVDVVFSAAVTDFTAGDLLITNGTVTSLTTSNNLVFTALISPTAAGLVEVSVPAGVANGAPGANDASNILTRTYDGSAPAGHSVAFVAPVNVSSTAVATLRLTAGEVGAQYFYAIESTGGGTPVTGNGTVASAPEDFGPINVAGLGDGTLSVSLTLVDVNGNAALPVSATIVKDLTQPTISTIVPPNDGTYDDL